MRRIEPQGLTGLLAEFHTAGVLDGSDAHVARRLARLVGETTEEVVLACALAVRAVRTGSVCVDLATVADSGFETDEEAVEAGDLPWPEPTAWLEQVKASPLVTADAAAPGHRPLRLVLGKVYLERYWAHEESVRRALVSRRDEAHAIDEAALADSLAHLFDGEEVDESQRLAAETAVRHSVTVLAGGPGTGKTTTVARMLAALAEQPGPTPRVALAAPTGKAAIRLEEAVAAQLTQLSPKAAEALAGVDGQTLHRLLGWVRDSDTRFAHDRHNPLPHDVVVVDECSMVSLHMMDRLLSALRPQARVVLVGDPDQLASVDAGAVLADITNASNDRRGVVRLTTNHRFTEDIAAVAAAIRDGDADATLEALAAGDAVEFVDVDLRRSGELAWLRERVVATHRRAFEAAEREDAAGALAALEEHRLLCAHNAGPFGVGPWQWQVERWLTEDIPGYRRGDDDFHVGRPLLIGRNQPDVELANGDVGVVVSTADGPRAAFARADGHAYFSPTQLSDVSTLYAMTIHKSQGSQYGHVTVLLPPPGSPLLRRELLYTAITRAKNRVTVVGTSEALREAVTTPARRATGLRERL